MPDKSTLTTFVKELRNNSEILSTNEAKIKQKVVQPILHQLGWDIFNDLEPEYSTGKNRVDYALKILNSYKVFMYIRIKLSMLSTQQMLGLFARELCGYGPPRASDQNRSPRRHRERFRNRSC
jgi:predicted type IV restriction endonuclease